MQTLNLKIIAFGILSIFFISCDEETLHKCVHSQKGVLKIGIGGCWIIQLSDSARLEPINLDEFDIELVEDKPVCVRFHERTDLGSYCMVGKIVEIDFIE